MSIKQKPGTAGALPVRTRRDAARSRDLRRRARLAYGLRDAVRSVEATGLERRRTPRVPVAAAAVRACAYDIEGLARALTDVAARERGVALARALLTDGAGPLYDEPGGADRLRAAVSSARAAL